MVEKIVKTAIIVARGQEEYLMPKRFFDSGDQCFLLEYVLDSVWTVTDQIVIVFNREPNLSLVESISPCGAKILVRQERNEVSLIAAGLKESTSEKNIVVQENIPFLKPNIVFVLFEAAKAYDAAIPRWSDGRIEFLPGVYGREPFLKTLSEGYKIERLNTVVDNLHAVRFVDIESELRPLDPELGSFFRVKTEKDLEKARRIASTRRIPSIR